MKPRESFTLIELLVVIAIIGILASITVSSLGGSRQKAGDIQTVAILKQVGGLLEQKAIDDTGSGYPTDTGADDDASWSILLLTFDSEQVAQLPGVGNGYAAHSDATSYCLWKVSKLDDSKTIYCETGARCSDREGVESTSLPAGCTH